MGLLTGGNYPTETRRIPLRTRYTLLVAWAGSRRQGDREAWPNWRCCLREAACEEEGEVTPPHHPRLILDLYPPLGSGPKSVSYCQRREDQ